MPELNNSKDIDENRVIAALSYVGILFLLPMLLKRDSKFAQFHAKQGLVLFIGWLIAIFVWWIFVIGWLYSMALLIFCIIGFVQAFTGKFYRLPLIADLSEKFNI
ncbi:MAG: DUF4870 domain-containing protein [Patescibacteria group bacterium]|jgi:uncharacterized membrane protein